MAPSVSTANPGNGNSGGSSAAPTSKPDTAATANFPPPKTDKPRPHICNVCTRSFARLEHLKRHERSHTKEKPFECPQCTRCFARRDLLLRHQQKLHKAGETSTRPRSGRRESTSGMPANGAGRVRKNSVASSVNGGMNPGMGGMRPRANTISHVDGAALNELLAANGQLGRNMGMHGGHSHHPSLAGFPNAGGYEFRGMANSLGHHGSHQGLPKLDTQLGLGLGGGLRTAPPVQSFNDPFDLEKMFGSGSTINPAQLHFSSAMAPSVSPFHNFPGFSGNPIEEDENFDWAAGFDHTMMMNGPGPTENAIDESSPSAISTTTQSGLSEVMLDASNNPNQVTTAMWHNPLVTSSSMVNPSFDLDTMGAAFAPELLNSLNTVSTKDGHDQGGPRDFYLSSPPPVSTMSPTAGMQGMPHHFFAAPLAFYSDSPSIGSSSINGSARQSSVTSISSDSITDQTRQALLLTLSQAQGYGHSQRKYSQPTISSPLSPTNVSKPTNPLVSLPSTLDLQRYVNAYIHYFHPHLPFLHVPTLSFDNHTYNNTIRNAAFTHDGIVGGGSCLTLAMAAIGALYEFDHSVANELFESAKRLIMFYLEERRRAGLSAAVTQSQDHTIQQTPMWLVQAMLLNLIYGHNCGDKQAAEVATTHCAALVSLAKAADLDKPNPEPTFGDNYGHTGYDVDMNMNGSTATPDPWRQNSHDSADEQTQWLRWKHQEERRRTFYAVFILSSLLVTAYAHHPRILNSEIRLDLPCDEDLWAADSPQAWAALGGARAAKHKSVSFASALSFLLQASMRKQEENGQGYMQHSGSVLSLDISESGLRPSTFGCYILINALHVYIWETRQRRTSRHWKSQETEAMIAQVEPALKAWQTAWRSNPHHSLERPNPFGPLSADSIPLLDCAYVRLFVDIGRTKDAIWQRDFDAMAEELARGIEVVQGADGGDNSSELNETKTTNTSVNSPGVMAMNQDMDAIGEPNPDHVDASNANVTNPSSKRERHLRKAAFYAADSLLMADKLKVTFADFNSRELPLQSAMCTFECAQVLAEWAATVQERVGPLLGILGKDDVDFTNVPAIMLLEDEDTKLLGKIADILQQADVKLSMDMNSSTQPANVPLLASMGHHGFGSKLLLIAAYMLEQAAVWPVTHVMAQALQAHADHMQRRSEASAKLFQQYQQQLQ